TQLLPIATERSVLRLAGPRLDKRLAHWQRISVAASEQCGRNRLMGVCAPVSFQDAIQGLEGVALFCHPEGALPLAQALAGKPLHISLLIGPEGGWSEAEMAQAKRAGLTPVTLGPRVLRTETAGLALTAATIATLGW